MHPTFRSTGVRMIVAIQILLLSQSAFACYSMPKTLARDHASLVAESRTIALVTAVAAATPGECAIKVIETLKGDGSTVLPLACKVPGPGDWMTTFSDHADDNFWTRRSGRLGIESDCGLIPPAFTIGSTYLVLLAEPDTKQFEQVDSTQDRWLQFVRAQVAAKSAQ